MNSSGNLVQVTSPELCIVSLVYDSSNRATAWINPMADRTSYQYDGSNRLTGVQSPSGLRHTITYIGSNQTMVTNPRGFVTTLNYNSGGALNSAIDGAGNLTSYSWDSLNCLTGIIDALRFTTSFTYTTLSNNVARLASIQQPSGALFTYTYNSNNQVSLLTDQFGNSTSLVWNRVLPGFVWVEIRRSKPFVCKAWEFGPGFLRRGALGGRDQQDPQVPPPKTPHPLPLFSVPSHNAAQRSRPWLPSPPRRSRPCPTSLSSLDSWLSPTPGGSNASASTPRNSRSISGWRIAAMPSSLVRNVALDRLSMITCRPGGGAISITANA